MNTSEQVNELAMALAKAQGQIKGAVKDAENPHFRSKYADLASVWDACRDSLSANGLSIVQSPRGIQTTAGGWAVELETRLLHSSGQWMADTLTVPVGKADAQGVGSAVTYARRYALAAFVGVAPEDDDGNAASAGAKQEQAVDVPAPPKGFTDWLLDLEVVAKDGQAALKTAWTESRADYRSYMTKHRAAEWDALKAKAAQNGLVTA